MNTTNDQFLSIISSEAKVLKPLWNLQPTNGNNNSHRQNHRQQSSLRSVSSGRGYNGKKSYLNSSDQIANNLDDANNDDYPKQKEDRTYNYDEWTTPSEETVPKSNGSIKQTNSYNTNANNSNSFNDFHEIANDNGQASNNATKFEYFYYQSTDNQSPTTNVNNNDCCYNLNNSGSTHSKDDFKSTTSPSKFDYNYYQNKGDNSKDDVNSANNHSAYGGNNNDSYSQRSSPDRFSSRSRGRGGRGRGRGGAAGNFGGGRNNDDFGSSSDRNIPTNDDFLCLISSEAKDYLKKPKVADAVAHARSANVIDSNSSRNNNNQNGFDTNWTGLSSQNKPFRKVSDTLSMNSSMSSKSFRGHGGGGNGGRTRSKIQDFDPILAEYTKSDNITVQHKMVIVNGEDLGHKTFCILQSGILMLKSAMVVHNVAKIADDFASEIQALGIWAFPFNGTTRNTTNLSHCRIPVTLMTYLATHPDVIPFPDIVVNFDSHVRHVEFLERYLNYRASTSGLTEKKTVQVYHLIEERSNFFPIFKGFIARKQKEIGKN